MKAGCKSKELSPRASPCSKVTRRTALFSATSLPLEAKRHHVSKHSSSCRGERPGRSEAVGRLRSRLHWFSPSARLSQTGYERRDGANDYRRLAGSEESRSDYLRNFGEAAF